MASESSEESLDTCSDLNRDEVRQLLVTYIGNFLYSERMSVDTVQELHEEIKKIQRTVMSRLKITSNEKNGFYEFPFGEGSFRFPQKRKPNALSY